VTRYVCEFVNKSGERRDVVVTLNDAEVTNVLLNFRTADLVARSYVMRRASRCVPAGFDPDLASIKQVQVH
jgi:hypothetical protein